MILNVVSGYVPQKECEPERKEKFWRKMDEVIQGIPGRKRVVIKADFYSDFKKFGGEKQRR